MDQERDSVSGVEWCISAIWGNFLICTPQCCKRPQCRTLLYYYEALVRTDSLALHFSFVLSDYSTPKSWLSAGLTVLLLHLDPRRPPKSPVGHLLLGCLHSKSRSQRRSQVLNEPLSVNEKVRLHSDKVSPFTGQCTDLLPA
jgi:hypothetical protein